MADVQLGRRSVSLRMAAPFRWLACLGLLVAVAPGPAAAEDPPVDSAWEGVETELAAPASLSDLRSPVVAHETRVEPDGALEIGGERIALRLVYSGRKVAWERTGPATTHKGITAVPGVLVLPNLHAMRYPIALRAAEDGRAVLAASALGLTLPLPGGTGLLVDSDLDGRLGSAGDGYVAPQSGTVGPWRGEAWSRRGGVRFRQAADATWEGTPIRQPQPGNEDHAAAWSLLQWRRQQCGVLPVLYDGALEDAMRKHAEYLNRHGEKTHHEEPGREGYTPEGDRAGRGSILGFGDKSLLSAMQVQLATLYHRTRVLQPGLTHTALTLHRGIFLLNVFERRGGPLADALLVYPPHGMQGVARRFHPEGENPMPVPAAKGDLVWLGTAVGVFSEPMRTAPSLVETPVLELVAGRRGSAVEAHLHYPGHPPNEQAGAPNRGNVARIPFRALRAKHRYEARALIVLPGGRVFDYQWWFLTGPE